MSTDLDAEMKDQAVGGDKQMQVLNLLCRGQMNTANHVYKRYWGEDSPEITDNGDDGVAAFAEFVAAEILEVRNETDEETDAPIWVFVHGTGGPHCQSILELDGTCLTEAWTWGFAGRTGVKGKYGDLADFMAELA